MPLEVRLALAGAVGFAVTFALTPVAVRVAVASGFLDRPGGHKGHAAPTPYLGGAALCAGAGAAALALADGAGRFPALLGAAAGLLVLGTLDDRRGVPGWLRLVAAGAGGAMLWAADLGWDTGLGAGADLALSCAWTGGLAIAFNLIDNIDGAAGAAGAAAAAGIAALAALADDARLGALALGLCGGCLAFLRYNAARPARIFLGDGGSLPLGFLVAGAAMSLPLEAEGVAVAVAAAVLLVAVPLADTAYAVASRLRRGVPVTRGGRDHPTPRALERLPSERSVALALGAAQACLCGLAVALVELAG